MNHQWRTQCQEITGDLRCPSCQHPTSPHTDVGTPEQESRTSLSWLLTDFRQALKPGQSRTQSPNSSAVCGSSSLAVDSMKDSGVGAAPPAACSGGEADPASCKASSNPVSQRAASSDGMRGNALQILAAAPTNASSLQHPATHEQA